jgi:hypothetical protein
MTSGLAIAEEMSGFLPREAGPLSRTLAFEPAQGISAEAWPDVPSVRGSTAGTAERGRIEVRPTGAALPQWLASTVRDLEEVLRLPAGWDSYGARSIDIEVVVLALEVLSQSAAAVTPAPIVVPTPEGGIQLEWHTQGRDIEVAILPGGRATLFLRLPATADVEDWEGSLLSERDTVVAALRRALAELTPVPAGGRAR